MENCGHDNIFFCYNVFSSYNDLEVIIMGFFDFLGPEEKWKQQVNTQFVEPGTGSKAEADMNLASQQGLDQKGNTQIVPKGTMDAAVQNDMKREALKQNAQQSFH